jgi:hypothetical protein
MASTIQTPDHTPLSLRAVHVATPLWPHDYGEVSAEDASMFARMYDALHNWIVATVPSRGSKVMGNSA